MAKTALVIEDNRIDRILLEQLLTQENFQVLTAASGEDGIVQFKQNRVDIVLVDVMMPHMDGFETTRRIKSLCGEDYVPVIFLTALEDYDAPLQCINAGGDDYIPKPINAHLLKAKLAAIERLCNLNRSLNSKHQELYRLHTKMRREQEIAESIYSGAVTANNVALDQIQVLHRPATTFSGDLFLTARQPSGGLNILVGDFTGHGLSSAIGAMPVSETFRAMTAKGFATLEILKQINHKLKTLLPTGMFMCAGFISVNRNLEAVSVWNGGLPDILIWEQKTGQIRQRIPSQQLPLGVDGTMGDQAEPQWLEIKEGDQILIYSDGLIEATNPDDEMFGESSLQHCLVKSRNRDCLLAQIEEDLKKFCGDRPFEDDITVVDIPYGQALLAAKETHPLTQNSKSAETQNWCWTLELRGATLRNTDPLPLAMVQLEELQEFRKHRESLYSILSELYTNALDHGVLGIPFGVKSLMGRFSAYSREREKRLLELSEGFVHIELEPQPFESGCRLLIAVGYGVKSSDSDDIATDISSLTIEPSIETLPLTHRLCESIEYDKRNNRVIAVYTFG
jgi:DNA-binding response OmpR family regulator